MKVVFLFLALAVGCSVALKPANPLGTYASLGRDINQILKRIPQDRLKHLFWRYLVNDEQFQSIVRYLHTPEGINVWLTAYQQPEISEFLQWTINQLGYDYSFESGSSEELDYLLQLQWGLYGGKPTGGWSGFINEYTQIYPSNTVQFLVRQKAAQSPVFAEFWSRLQGLRVVYDRVVASPEYKVFADRLTSLGVNVPQLEAIIRRQYGWDQNGAAQSIGRTALGRK